MRYVRAAHVHGEDNAAAPPLACLVNYWTSSRSTFCRATHAQGDGNAGRAAARQ